MAADIRIFEVYPNAGSPSSPADFTANASTTYVNTDKTTKNIRFKGGASGDQGPTASDVPGTTDTSDRVNIPSSGTNYSMSKQFAFWAQTYFLGIQDLKVYLQGTGQRPITGSNPGTWDGVDILYKVNSSFVSNTNSQLSGAASLFGKTNSSPVLLSTPALVLSGTGYQGNLLQMQLSVASTATGGLLGNGTPLPVVFAYSES